MSQFRIEWSDDGYCVLIDRPEVVWARDVAPVLGRKSSVFVYNEDGRCIEVPPQKNQARAFVLAYWKQARGASDLLICVC